MLRASLQKCTMAAGKSSCNIYILSHSMGMGRGDGQKPGDVRPASPMQARSQQLLTHMAKDRVANVLEGERGKYLVLSPKKRRYLQLCMWMEGREQNGFGTSCPTRRGTYRAPSCLPTPLASPVPSHDRHSHPGFVQETWVRSSPRADVILLRAAHGGTQAPASHRAER